LAGAAVFAAALVAGLAAFFAGAAALGAAALAGAAGAAAFAAGAGAAGAAGAGAALDPVVGDDRSGASEPPQAIPITISIEATSKPTNKPDLRSIFILIKISSKPSPLEYQRILVYCFSSYITHFTSTCLLTNSSATVTNCQYHLSISI
jgi:hypothetical protein